jgi:hypothetical protein
MTENWKINTAENCFEPSALTREHPELQKMKFLNCFIFFEIIYPSWIRFRIANPDPGTPLYPDPIRIRILNTASCTCEYFRVDRADVEMVSL